MRLPTPTPMALPPRHTAAAARRARARRGEEPRCSA